MRYFLDQNLPAPFKFALVAFERSTWLAAGGQTTSLINDLLSDFLRMLQISSFLRRARTGPNLSAFELFRESCVELGLIRDSKKRRLESIELLKLLGLFLA